MLADDYTLKNSYNHHLLAEDRNQVARAVPINNITNAITMVIIFGTLVFSRVKINSIGVGITSITRIIKTTQYPKSSGGVYLDTRSICSF